MADGAAALSAGRQVRFIVSSGIGWCIDGSVKNAPEPGHSFLLLIVGDHHAYDSAPVRQMQTGFAVHVKRPASSISSVNIAAGSQNPSPDSSRKDSMVWTILDNPMSSA